MLNSIRITASEKKTIQKAKVFELNRKNEAEKNRDKNERKKIDAIPMITSIVNIYLEIEMVILHLKA